MGSWFWAQGAEFLGRNCAFYSAVQVKNTGRLLRMPPLTFPGAFCISFPFFQSRTLTVYVASSWDMMLFNKKKQQNKCRCFFGPSSDIQGAPDSTDWSRQKSIWDRRKTEQVLQRTLGILQRGLKECIGVFLVPSRVKRVYGYTINQFLDPKSIFSL